MKIFLHCAFLLFVVFSLVALRLALIAGFIVGVVYLSALALGFV